MPTTVAVLRPLTTRLVVALLGVAVIAAGCSAAGGGYSSESIVEEMMQGQNEFERELAEAQGTSIPAKLEEVSCSAWEETRMTGESGSGGLTVYHYQCETSWDEGGSATWCITHGLDALIGFTERSRQPFVDTYCESVVPELRSQWETVGYAAGSR